MKQQLIIGNWKSNKTTREAEDWLSMFKTLEFQIDASKTVLVCAPFTLLPLMSDYINTHSMKVNLCAQDVSPFAPGPYTGEVNGFQIKEFAQYVLIGHSERRDNFHETDELLAKKVEKAHEAGLKSILCVQNETTPVPTSVDIIAYEPPGAISTVSKGIPDNPKDVEVVVKRIKESNSSTPVIYGGSVNPENVSLFMSIAEIEGVLPGAASLDPHKFAQIAINA